MTLAVPNPSTAAAGAKQTATTWNKDVRDAVNYLLALQGGLGRRNFLKNPRMDLWQRGTSFAIPASTKTYTADRWVAYRAATGSTVSRQTGPTGQSYGLRYQRDPGNTSTATMRILQALPTANSLPMAGQVVSLRINLAAGANFSPAGGTVSLIVTTGTGTDQDPVTTWTGTADALSITQAVTTGSTDYVFDNVIIPANTNQVKVEASWVPVGTAGANDWCQLNGVQVSAGSMAGFEQIPPEQNLAECQAFYRIVDDGELAVYYNSASSVMGWCRFDPTMRTTPTVTYPTGTWTATLAPAATKTSTNSITPGTASANSLEFTHGGYTTVAAGSNGYMSTVPGAGILLNAEL